MDSQRYDSPFVGSMVKPLIYRLIQRNKNILNDLLNKQGQETKKTLQHIKHTLGETKGERFFNDSPTQQHPQRATSAKK